MLKPWPGWEQSGVWVPGITVLTFPELMMRLTYFQGVPGSRSKGEHTDCAAGSCWDKGAWLLGRSTPGRVSSQGRHMAGSWEQGWVLIFMHQALCKHNLT